MTCPLPNSRRFTDLVPFRAVLLALVAAVSPEFLTQAVHAAPAQRFVQYLESPSHASAGQFGEELATNGRVLAVGAPDEGLGHVYVYENQMSGAAPWSLALDLPRPGMGGSFGQAIECSGDQFAISGAFFAPQHAGSGLVFIYDMSDPAAPILSQTLFPTVSTSLTSFGEHMAMNDRWLAVVATYGTGPSNAVGGVVYVFENQNEIWVERYRVEADDAQVDDRFGNTIAIDGDLLLVGSSRTLFQGRNLGAAYVFELDSTQATQLQRFDRVAVPFSSNPSAVFPSTLHIDHGEIVLLDRNRGDIGSRYLRNPATGIWELIDLTAGLSTLVDYRAGLTPPGVYLGTDYIANVYSGFQPIHSCLGHWGRSGTGLVPPRDLQWPIRSIGKVAHGGGQLMSGVPYYPRPANPNWYSYGSVFIWELDQDFFDIGDCLTEGEVTCDVGTLQGTLPCPCGGTSIDPQVGCLNSTGQGGRLRGVGAPQPIYEDMLLAANQLPAHTTVVFRWAVEQPVMPAIVGAGISCIGSQNVGFALATSDAAGLAILENPAPPPNWVPSVSERVFYQAFYRDRPTSSCPQSLNATNGLAFDARF